MNSLRWNHTPKRISSTSVHGSFIAFSNPARLDTGHFVPRRLVCLFFFLRSIPGLHEHVFFVLHRYLIFAPGSRLGGSLRRRRAYLCSFFFVSACISASIRSRWPGTFFSGFMLAGTAFELECAWMGQSLLVLRSFDFLNPLSSGLYDIHCFCLALSPSRSSETFLLDRYISRPSFIIRPRAGSLPRRPISAFGLVFFSLSSKR